MRNEKKVVQACIAAGFELFPTKGFYQVTCQDVVDTSRCAESSLRRHFRKGTRQIHEEVIATAAVNLRDLFREKLKVSELGPQGILEAYLRSVFLMESRGGFDRQVVQMLYGSEGRRLVRHLTCSVEQLNRIYADVDELMKRLETLGYTVSQLGAVRCLLVGALNQFFAQNRDIKHEESESLCSMLMLTFKGIVVNMPQVTVVEMQAQGISRTQIEKIVSETQALQGSLAHVLTIFK